MKATKVMTVLILILGVSVLIWGLMISPYAFAWDPLLKQRNDEGIFIARVLFSCLLVWLGGGLFLARKGGGYWVKAVYIGALIVVVFKLLEMVSL